MAKSYEWTGILFLVKVMPDTIPVVYVHYNLYCIIILFPSPSPRPRPRTSLSLRLSLRAIYYIIIIGLNLAMPIAHGHAIA